MIEIVKNFIIENNLTGKKILVGLSGGADSITLCDILCKIKNELNLTLIFIHLNHNWRGIEAKYDEDFCKNFAKNNGVEFYTEILNENIKKNETTAREARYNFFEKCIKKFNGDAVFLAHNKNDNIETLIYRLIKGTGPQGLNSIPKIRDFYYRPLLDISRNEIEQYVKYHNLQFRIDKSNFDTIHKRNLIREKILPEMAEINGEFLNSLSTFIKINQMTQNIVEKTVNNALLTIENNGKILRDKFLKLDIELQFEIINKNLKGLLKNRDFKTIEKIVNFIQNNNSSQISINSNTFLKIYNNEIYILNKYEKKQSVSTNLVEGINYFLNYKITVEKTNTPQFFPKENEGIYFLNLDFNLPYILRTRQNGDKIQPFGSNHNQKLKELFIKKKIPQELRDKIPLIAINHEVLLIFNIATGEKLRVDKNQKFCYKLTIEEI